MLTRVVIALIMLSAAINAGADDWDIHKMMVGSKVMEVVQTRQLTFREDGDVQNILVSPNGKYAVYLTVQPNADSNDRVARLHLVKLSSNKTILLLEGDLPNYNYPDNHQWKFRSGIMWSPDSRWIVLQAGWKANDNAEIATDNIQEKRARKEALLFFDTAGNMVTTYYVPDETQLFPAEWSPDSRKFALVYGKRNQDAGEHNNAVVVFDVVAKQAQTIFSNSSKRSFMFEGWIDGGEGVLCHEYLSENKIMQRKIYLDGRAPVELDEEPDRRGYAKQRGIPFAIKKAEGGFAVEDIATGETLCIIKGMEPYSVYGIPKARLLTYMREQTIQNGPDGQKTKLNSLWLMYPEGEKKNTMCLALGIDPGGSSSDDCRKLGYTRNGRAYITELEQRPATAREKVAAGIRLTEDETKALMLESAHQIADAIEASISCSEYYPPQDAFIERTKQCLRDANAILQPGTDKIAVTYFAPDEQYHIGNPPPPDTVLVTMHSGYGWQINIYADSRVQEVPR